MAGALLVGCPGPSTPSASQGGGKQTLAAEARQVQRRLDALAALPQPEAAGDAKTEAAAESGGTSAAEVRAAEVEAVKVLRVWLTQRRQWRTGPYTVAFKAGPERLDRKALAERVASKAALELELSLPELEPAPKASRRFHDASVLEPLLDLVAPPAE